MKTKIKTIFGYLCLPEEKPNETISVPYNETNCHENIDIITITSDEAKKAYHTINPFGVGYTNCFDCFLTSQISVMKLTAGKPERKIDFIEIS